MDVSTTDVIFFFPQSYTIVDAKEGEVMVVVRHEKEHDGRDYYNLYVSDLTGVKYSLSLENILSDRTPIWGKNTTLVDLHRVSNINVYHFETHQVYRVIFNWISKVIHDYIETHAAISTNQMQI